MALGLALAVFVPAIGELLHGFSVGSLIVPIASGLLVMMYPVLAKVRYSTSPCGCDRACFRLFRSPA
jgi:ACR3 family arsenite transporter